MAADLFRQFQTYWKAGAEDQFNLECHAGEVWMNLKIHLHRPPPPPPLHSRQHEPPPFREQQSRQSPSRLRRRARRAKARAAAEAAVNKATEDAAVQTKDDLLITSLDTDNPVDASIHLPPVGSVQHHKAAVHDVFCPDSVYNVLPSAPPPTLLDIIPQLDGQAIDATEDIAAEEHEEESEWINPNPATGMWTCRCCYYAHSFKTEGDLKNHHDTLSIEYSECNICYPWHVWS